MEINKNLKYNPPENYPNHNTNLEDDALVPYKVYIKYTTNLTGAKIFYLTPNNLNINILTPSTQELAINEQVTLLKEKFPSEIMALVNNVTGMNLKSYRNDYKKLIDGIKQSESEKSFSTNELKFVAYVQQNPYFEYKQIPCTVTNKQGAGDKYLYTLKSSDMLYNIESTKDTAGKLNFTLNEPGTEKKIEEFEPIYHSNKKIILTNLDKEFKDNTSNVLLPIGSKKVNHLVIYGPPSYDVGYDATDFEKLGESRAKAEKSDLLKNWHTKREKKEVKIRLELSRTGSGYAYRFVNIPEYPKFTYWKDDVTQREKVKDFIYRIKDTIDNLIYSDAYTKNNTKYSKKNNIERGKLKDDNFKPLLKQKKRERTKLEKEQVMWGEDVEDFTSCSDDKIGKNKRILENKTDRKKSVITVNKKDWNSKLYLNRFFTFDDEGKSMLPENLKNASIMSYNYYYKPYTGREKNSKMFASNEDDKTKAKAPYKEAEADNFAESFTFNKAKQKSAKQANQKWITPSIEVNLHFDLAYFEKPPLTIEEFLNEKKESFFSNIRESGKKGCHDLYKNRCKAYADFKEELERMFLLDHLKSGLAGVKSLFVPETMQTYMERVEKIDKGNYQEEEKRKEKQAKNIANSLNLIIRNLKSYKDFKKDNSKKELIFEGEEEELLKHYLRAGNLALKHG